MSVQVFASPGGHQYVMDCRDDTTDSMVAGAVAYPSDEYDLPRGLRGWAMDVGAHIGSVTVPLLMDNPELRVIAIEALPENIGQLVKNLELNGLSGRYIAVHAAAADSAAEQRIGYSLNFPPDDSDFNRLNRFIGSMSAPDGVPEVRVKGVTLRGAMLLRGPEQDEPVQWLKIDCEGCEYAFLRSDWLTLVDVIVGEVHLGAQRLRDILSLTHEVVVSDDFGPFVASLRHPVGVQ